VCTCKSAKTVFVCPAARQICLEQVSAGFTEQHVFRFYSVIRQFTMSTVTSLTVGVVTPKADTEQF
jgi:hypothetical protein